MMKSCLYIDGGEKIFVTKLSHFYHLFYSVLLYIMLVNSIWF